jgi:hypothetical protein
MSLLRSSFGKLAFRRPPTADQSMDSSQNISKSIDSSPIPPPDSYNTSPQISSSPRDPSRSRDNPENSTNLNSLTTSQIIAQTNAASGYGGGIAIGNQLDSSMMRGSLNQSLRDGGSSPYDLPCASVNQSISFQPRDRSSSVPAINEQSLRSSRLMQASNNNSNHAGSVDLESHRDINVSIDIHQDPETLFQLARSNTITIRGLANETKIFQVIEGSDDLVRKLDEFLVELDHQKDSILDAMLK